MIQSTVRTVRIVSPLTRRKESATLDEVQAQDIIEITDVHDVKQVAEFMQTKIAASRLVAVADGLAAMAPLLWGRFQPEAIQAIRLEAQPIAAVRSRHARKRKNP